MTHRARDRFTVATGDPQLHFTQDLDRPEQIVAEAVLWNVPSSTEVANFARPETVLHVIQALAVYGDLYSTVLAERDALRAEIARLKAERKTVRDFFSGQDD